MKKLLISAMCFLFILSCGTFDIRTEIRERRAIEPLSKSGLIIRIHRDLRIGREDYVKSFSHWMAGMKSLKSVTVINDGSDRLTYFDSDQDRFFQMTDENRFLKYKSIGVINLYLKHNREELKKIAESHSLDSFIIYEVYGVVANEMQFIDYDSSLVVADAELNVVYLDRQNHTETTDEIGYERMKIKFIDSVSDRLMQTLVSLGFFER